MICSERNEQPRGTAPYSAQRNNVTATDDNANAPSDCGIASRLARTHSAEFAGERPDGEGAGDETVDVAADCEETHETFEKCRASEPCTVLQSSAVTLVCVCVRVCQRCAQHTFHGSSLAVVSNSGASSCGDDCTSHVSVVLCRCSLSTLPLKAVRTRSSAQLLRWR